MGNQAKCYTASVLFFSYLILPGFAGFLLWLGTNQLGVLSSTPSDDGLKRNSISISLDNFIGLMSLLALSAPVGGITTNGVLRAISNFIKSSADDNEATQMREHEMLAEPLQALAAVRSSQQEQRTLLLLQLPRLFAPFEPKKFWPGGAHFLGMVVMGIAVSMIFVASNFHKFRNNLSNHHLEMSVEQYSQLMLPIWFMVSAIVVPRLSGLVCCGLEAAAYPRRAPQQTNSAQMMYIPAPSDPSGRLAVAVSHT